MPNVIRTGANVMSANEALEVFRMYHPNSDVTPVMHGTRGLRAKIRRVTGVTPTKEQITALMSSTGGHVGKVNRYFMYPRENFEQACFNAVGLA